MLELLRSQGLLQNTLRLWYILQGAAVARTTTHICLLVLSGLYILFCTLAVGWLSFLYLAITVHLGLVATCTATAMKIGFIVMAVSLSIAQEAMWYLGHRSISQTISAVNIFISHSTLLYAGTRVSMLIKR